MSALQALVDAVGLGALYALAAMGIGLIFGVMRVINFAHGELFMAGAYALALTKDGPLAVSIVACFGIVIVLALAMEVAYRPLREAAPLTTLVATFAVSFLLQSIALLVFGPLGSNASVAPSLNQAVTFGEIRIRWVTFVAIGVGALLLAGTAVVLGKTTIGLQMRAAAADFRTARLLGVRANTVIAFAFFLGAILAAAATIVFTIQQPLVTPRFGLGITIVALVGVVVGGLDRLVSATLGGFAVGFVTSLLGFYLPAEQRVFVQSFLFALVILVLLARPSGLFAPAKAAVERV